jgi:hypothetical protein
MTWDEVVAIALPGVALSTSYGTPALKVRGRLIARLRPEDAGTVMVLRLPVEAVDMLRTAEPAVFFQTPHYEGYPAVLVRLPATTPERLGLWIEQAWAERASKAQRAAR